MDLKKRFSALGLEEPIVAKILPVITPEEAAVFYNSSDADLKSKIPDLLERIVNKSSFNEELDLNNIGLKTPGSLTKENAQVPISQQLDKPLPIGLPKPNETLSAERKSPGLKILVFLLLTTGLVFILSGLKSDPVAVEKKPEKEKKKNLLTTNVQELEKVEVEDAPLPYPPDFRGAWMFMPWDDYEPSIICNDGRFKEIEDKFTVQFWIKLTKKFPETVGIFAFFANKKPAESIFINEEGILCFSPGPKEPNLALLKPLPDNGRHFHIAICRDGEICRLFVNGKMRQEMRTLQGNERPSKDFITLFKSDSTLKGIGIDELMISNDILFEGNFTPERILTMSESTVLYIPFEKNDDNYFRCYGFSKFKEHLFTGGKWLNVQNEVQQVINHLEFSQELKEQSSDTEKP